MSTTVRVAGTVLGGRERTRHVGSQLRSSGVGHRVKDRGGSSSCALSQPIPTLCCQLLGHRILFSPHFAYLSILYD